MPICPVCKKSVSSGTTYRKQLYHPDCFQKKLDAARAKDAKKAAVASDPDVQALRQYVLSIFEINELTPLLSKQMEAYGKQFGYADVLYAMRYFYELSSEDKEYEGEPTLGIVPYIIKEALDYRYTVEEAREINQSFLASEDETVYIQPKHATYQPRDYKIEEL